MRKIIAVLLVGGWVTVAQAQSTVDMEEFDLVPNTSSTTANVETPKVEPASEMEACLLDQSQCANAEFRSGTAISMDDVVNLQIVKHDDDASGSDQNGQATLSSSSSTSEPSTQALPTIDIEILFDSGSDRFRTDQENKLRDLAMMLGSERFDGYRFLFLGHTDAKGNEDFNLSLSQRRAESVAQSIRFFTGLSPHRVLASGLGETRLKTPYDPLSGINRRVQLVLLPQ